MAMVQHSVDLAQLDVKAASGRVMEASAAQEDSSDDGSSSCGSSSVTSCGVRCEQLAGQYRQVLDQIMMVLTDGAKQPLVPADTQQEQGELMVALIEAISRHLLDHVDMDPLATNSWVAETAHALWRYAKWLKEEGKDTEWENAQRITIYHCRAMLYRQDNQLDRARLYYRKCTVLRTSQHAQLRLQDQAQEFIQQHSLTTTTNLPLLSPTTTPTSSSPPSVFLPSTSTSSVATTGKRSMAAALPSPPSIVSSTATLVGSSYFAQLRSTPSTPSTVSLSSASSTSSIKSCGQCGLEKLAMPVCAKCKSQRYCSFKCMKAHRSIHASSCNKL
ncbi:hypothetical protein BC940DRAFT_322509 [Gongronella butleri]|nr:hypothetical protein BC940DRAFT_322509 [Gongronella butleri]